MFQNKVNQQNYLPKTIEELLKIPCISDNNLKQYDKAKI